MSDPESLNFMQLKKWLAAAGAPKATLDNAFDKDRLLLMLPEYREAGLAAAGGGGAKPAAAKPAAKPAAEAPAEPAFVKPSDIKKNQAKGGAAVADAAVALGGAKKAAKAMETLTSSGKKEAEGHGDNRTTQVPSMMANKFKDSEVEDFRKAFNEFDADGSGDVNPEELRSLLHRNGMDMPVEEVAAFMKEVDLDGSGSINFGEFLHLMERARRGGFSGKGSDMVKTIQRGVEKVTVKGDYGGYHSYTEEEKRFFGAFINAALRDDPHCQHVMPINLEGGALFEAVHDGILCCKLVNVAVPGTIDPRVINTKVASLNVHTKTENQNLALNSARSIGCQIRGINSQDVINGEPHLVLALLWQLVKVAVLSHISLKEHPYLVRLLQGDESIEQFVKLAPEKILLRWVNFLLKETECDRTIKNFSGDIKDSVVYTHLLHRMQPDKCDKAAIAESDLGQRAEMVVTNANKIGIRKIMSGADIAAGNGKLNLMFVAELFNTFPCLEPLTEDEAKEVEASATDMLAFSEEGTREERVFRLWVNSLDIQDVFFNDLYEDVKSGWALLQVIDAIFPGSVEFKRANKNPGTVFKRLENCGIAVETGRKVGLKLVGLEGKDICDGVPKFVLTMCWQLWRTHIGNMLQQVSESGKRPDDKEIVAWANAKVQSKGYAGKIKDFKDAGLSDGQFLAQLLESVHPGAVDFELLTPGTTEEGSKSNAEYILSVARKVGCTIFNLPDDITDIRSKMLMILVSMVMLVDAEKNKK